MAATRIQVAWSCKMSRKSRTSVEGSEDARRNNAVWSAERDGLLLDVLLEEQSKGNRIDGTWTSIAYANIVKVLSEKIGYQYHKENIKNRMKTMKSNFHTCNELFKHLSGFSWNPITELFEAEAEVWDEVLKENPKAYKWKYTKIPHFEKLYELFARDRATGQRSMTAAERVQQWTVEHNVHVQDLNSETEEDAINLEGEGPSPVPTPTPMPMPTPSHSQANTEGTSSSRLSKRKARQVDTHQAEVESMNASICQVAEAIRETNKVIERMTVRVYSEAEIFDELQMIGIHPDMKFDALEFLANNPQKARLFFGVPREDRLQYLGRLMRLI